MEARDRLFVAIDETDADTASGLVNELSSHVGGFKFGLQYYTANGPAFKSLSALEGRSGFIDLKFHDIPNTVAGAITSAAILGIAMVNVHCLGGSKMLRFAANAAAKAEAKYGHRPRILGVTILTSHSYADLLEIGLVPNSDRMPPGVREKFEKDIITALVLRYAQMAKDCGLDGVIASPQETKLLREVLGDSFIIGNPGIRPVGTALGDQTRVGTPAQAIKDGATFIVVGRPITQPEQGNTVEAARAIVAEIETVITDRR